MALLILHYQIFFNLALQNWKPFYMFKVHK